jgi:glycosyltransferase involved in cell wall biosynthesis
MVNKLSEIQLIDNFTGFGLYDKDVINILKSIKDPYPYFRGLIAEIGLSIKTIDYDQPVRIRGITKNNFYSLYDIGMLGIISHSKVPLRIATISGFILSFISLFISFIYFVIKILYWDTFDMGIAPIIVGMFFFFSIQLLFIGIIGEYIAFLYVKLQDRPLVVEKQRINFD